VKEKHLVVVHVTDRLTSISRSSLYRGDVPISNSRSQLASGNTRHIDLVGVLLSCHHAPDASTLITSIGEDFTRASLRCCVSIELVADNIVLFET
jgi:hypothetical protein